MRAKLDMISEGESDLVLNRVEYEMITQALNKAFELLGDCVDAVGTGGRNANGYRGYWADYRAGMRSMRALLVECASVRAILMGARNGNTILFERKQEDRRHQGDAGFQADA